MYRGKYLQRWRAEPHVLGGDGLPGVRVGFVMLKPQAYNAEDEDGTNQGVSAGGVPGEKRPCLGRVLPREQVWVEARGGGERKGGRAREGSMVCACEIEVEERWQDCLLQMRWRRAGEVLWRSSKAWSEVQRHQKRAGTRCATPKTKAGVVEVVIEAVEVVEVSRVG
ncbi:hypothetical protein BD779DRAFT_1790570 [Infundibulicybe gibba]|nr:hypothetical protein BD779DRAFT_1790570 [Infundibulicybe gibba]